MFKPGDKVQFKKSSEYEYSLDFGNNKGRNYFHVNNIGKIFEVEYFRPDKSMGTTKLKNCDLWFSKNRFEKMPVFNLPDHLFFEIEGVSYKKENKYNITKTISLYG